METPVTQTVPIPKTPKELLDESNEDVVVLCKDKRFTVILDMLERTIQVLELGKEINYDSAKSVWRLKLMPHLDISAVDSTAGSYCITDCTITKEVISLVKHARISP